MKKTIFVFILGLVGSGLSQTFQDFLDRVNAVSQGEKTAIVDSFMAAVPAFPYTEQDTLAHFLYRGGASSVTVPGDANSWTPTAFPMSRITDTDLWYHTRVFETDARLDYKFVLNGNNWILDPRNPLQIMGGFGPNSELRMPGYVPSPEIQYDPSIGHGTLFDTTFASAALGNSRTVRVYIPAAYASGQDSFNIVLFHDGLEYITLAHAVNVLDYLIAHQRIQPCFGIFVPPVNRTTEYAGSLKESFSAFIVQDVMAWADKKYRIRKHPQNRAVLGASNGGNISLWMGLHYPHVFGNVAAQSSNVENSISNGFQNDPKQDLRIYLDIGTYDIPYLIPLVRNLKTILKNRGYDYHFKEFHEGHSWGSWKAHLDNALEFLYPGPGSHVHSWNPLPESMHLSQNYPNPFNPVTTIEYRITEQEFVELSIFNNLGQKVKSLIKERQTPGVYRFLWDGTDFEGRKVSTGNYIYQLRINGHVQNRKMIFLG